MANDGRLGGTGLVECSREASQGWAPARPILANPAGWSRRVADCHVAH